MPYLVGVAHRCIPITDRITNKTPAQKVAAWRAKNRDRYRAYMRGYMRKRRNASATV